MKVDNDFSFMTMRYCVTFETIVEMRLILIHVANVICRFGLINYFRTKKE